MNNFLKKLELDLILEELSEYAIMPITKSKILKISPLTDVLKIKSLLVETNEALGIIERLGRAPINIVSDYVNIIKVATKGGKLDGLELYETYRLYLTVRENNQHLDFLEKENIPCEHYKDYVEKLYIDEYLEAKIKKSVDEDGYILDDASPTLKSIRQKLRSMDSRIKAKLQEIVSKEASRLSQNTVSIRNDRYVIPVRAEYKNMIKGTIQDVSASNQTFYIEPLAIMELTNEKQKLIREEVKEIDRILSELSALVGDNFEVLKSNFDIIGKIDFVFAKGMLALKQEARLVNINTDHIMELRNARHPLLRVEKVIPNNISFDDYLGIVITGPNTGGKTVLLKTVGLLSLMTKCGLLVPADENSNIMIYDKVCCDIGDDQSIQANLSTFSSHMKNITDIINMVTPNSLVLFDEIGGGTDPDEGSKLAIAILDYLMKNKISFITTTHYSELKAYAYDNELVVNASMEFNQNTLSPTYKLVIGMPGASNALAIAKRLGLKNEIIEDAKERSVTANNDLKTLMAKLEKRSYRLVEEEKRVKKLEKELALAKKEYDEKLEALEKEKQLILEKANQKAEKHLTDVALQAEIILEELKELQAKGSVKLHEVIAARKELDNLADKEIKVKPTPKPVNREIHMGDDVYISQYGQYGNVIKVLRNGSYEVAMGNVTTVLKKNQLEVVDKVPESKVPKTKIEKVRVVTSAKMALSLDLRGERYEDAKERLSKYFDDALLTGLKQFTIIHGYGTGAIRGLVQDFLKKNKNVQSFRYGGEGEGGMGSTVVVLK